jgi:hypothetical protein
MDKKAMSTTTNLKGKEEKKDAKINVQLKAKEENSFVMTKLSIITDNLETYVGRDTVITLTHYLALIIADLCTYYRIGAKKRKGQSPFSAHFVNMFVQLSNCRVMLRLFDDFGAIRDLYRFYKSQSIKVDSLFLLFASDFILNESLLYTIEKKTYSKNA